MKIKWLEVGTGLNLFIFAIVLLSIGLEIYTLILGIAFVLFVFSTFTIKKGYDFGRYFGMIASLIMIIIFIRGFIRGFLHTIINPLGMVFDFQSIINIFAPIFYGIILCNLIAKKISKIVN